MSKAVFLADPLAKLHDTGPSHPENVARWDAAVRGLGERPLLLGAPRSATLEELQLCHKPDYVQRVRHDVESGYSSMSTGDTDICIHSYSVATRGVGTVLTAVDRVMTGDKHRAFSVVRPPGHHATPTHGMGFCLFNNVAIGARYAQKIYGVERVLIVDWDVHHGNGTQDIFYDDGSVYFFSTHQYPWYPGTGALDETGVGSGAGTTRNVPFAAGSGRDEILGAFESMAEEMHDYRPDLVIISAGFDSRLGDPLGQFRLEDKDFADLTRLTLEIADKYAHGRVVSVLEGGYNLAGLTAAVGAHVAVLDDE